MDKLKKQSALTETDISELEEAFKHLDRDNDGLVTFVEIVTSLKSEGVIRDSQCVRKEIAEKYKDGINFQQFCDLVSRLSGHEKNFIYANKIYVLCRERLSEEEMKRAFEYFDVDKNGKVELLELSKSCKEMRKGIPNKKLVEMFKSADVNGDGFIDYKEFKNQIKD